MAEMLMKAIDYTHPDPEIDRKGAYKKGMVVVVENDGHSWGNEECLPKFTIIKLPNVSKDKINKYVEHQLREKTENDNEDEILIHRRRQWKFDWDSSPDGIKSKLDAGGIVVKTSNYHGDYDCTWGQFKQFFKDLKNNVSESMEL